MWPIESSDFAARLAHLGVVNDTLSPTEKRSLNDEGYLILTDLLDPPTVKELRANFERVYEEERRSEEEETQGETGTRHVVRLAHAHPACRQLFLHPKLLAAVYQIFQRPFIAVDVHGRDPLPGYGQQGLHTDWQPRSASDPYYIVTTVCLLDDFTEENGATRVVPGSHHVGGQPGRSFATPNHRHPEEVIVTAPAGSVLIFNGHLLHSGRKNESQGPRRTLRCTLLGAEMVTSNGFEYPDLSPIPERAHFLFLP